MTDSDRLVEELFELVNAGQLATVRERLVSEQKARDRQVRAITRVERRPPIDHRDLMLAELESYGLPLRAINLLEQSLFAWAAPRGEVGIECCQVSELLKYSPDNLRDIPNFGESQLLQLRCVLAQLRLRLRGDTFPILAETKPRKSVNHT